jgi:hypothetical protein
MDNNTIYTYDCNDAIKNSKQVIKKIKVKGIDDQKANFTETINEKQKPDKIFNNM